jgi:hypothetical protein
VGQLSRATARIAFFSCVAIAFDGGADACQGFVVRLTP